MHLLVIHVSIDSAFHERVELTLVRGPILEDTRGAFDLAPGLPFEDLLAFHAASAAGGVVRDRADDNVATEIVDG